MRLLRSIVALSCALILSTASAEVYHFDFVSCPSPSGTAAAVQFDGDPLRAVSFADSSEGRDFLITRSGGLNLDNISGNIGGVFTLGTIGAAGGLETAPVTGIGQFSLTDPDGEVLSADLTWNDVFVLAGSHGGLNVGNAANLSNWSYNGSYAPFLAILHGDPGSHSVNVSFQFNPSRTLGQLMASGAQNATTYSGSLSFAVPEPGTWTLLAGAVAGGLAWRIRRRRNG